MQRIQPLQFVLFACVFGALCGCADARASTNRAARAAAAQQVGGIIISRVMVDPSSVSDELGEWIELANTTTLPIDLRGWRLKSARDPGYAFVSTLIVPPRGTVILGRSADVALNGGIHVRLAYSGIALANARDWLVLAAPTGASVDSLAWDRASRGRPVEHGVNPSVSAAEAQAQAQAQAQARAQAALPGSPTANPPDSAPTPRELTVRILDVGQGDAILIQNGGSTVLVDGGPSPAALGRHLDLLGLDETTIDAVVLTHAHADHYQGLRELFATRRHITVRYFWENQDPSTNVTLGKLRDSIAARVSLGLAYRDTDDPCATGAPLCTITLKGGEKIQIRRPNPRGRNANNRSPALTLVGRDSASFTMWMAGDAEVDDIQWFTRAGYRKNPGMRVDVLKADHHGSCNGVTDLYLDLLHPSLLVASLAAVNDYGHMHAQAKTMYARHGIPWYRTDQNGTITLRAPGTPGSRFSVTIDRGGKNLSGPSDRRSTSPECGR